MKYLQKKGKQPDPEAIAKEIEDHNQNKNRPRNRSTISNSKKDSSIAVRDDLKFRSIAAYKAIKKGNVGLY